MIGEEEDAEDKRDERCELPDGRLLRKNDPRDEKRQERDNTLKG